MDFVFKKEDIKNAVITGVSLSIADHGMLSGWVYLESASGGQGFGGCNLHVVPDHKEITEEKLLELGSHGAWAAHFITRCVQIAGVQKWENLVGRPVRVVATHNGVRAIGHHLKDQWFCPETDFATMREGFLAAHPNYEPK